MTKLCLSLSGIVLWIYRFIVKIFVVLNYFLAILRLLMCNFQFVLLVDSNCKVILVFSYIIFYFCVILFLMTVLWILSQKSILVVLFDNFYLLKFLGPEAFVL